MEPELEPRMEPRDGAKAAFFSLPLLVVHQFCTDSPHERHSHFTGKKEVVKMEPELEPRMEPRDGAEDKN